MPGGDTLSYVEYIYSNRKPSIAYYHGIYSQPYKSRYQYNNLNQLIRKNGYSLGVGNDTSQIAEHSIYEYNASSQCTKASFFNNRDSLDYYCTYEYNNGDNTLLRYYSPTDSIFATINYSFDDKTNYLKHSLYSWIISKNAHNILTVSSPNADSTGKILLRARYSISLDIARTSSYVYDSFDYPIIDSSTVLSRSRVTSVFKLEYLQ